MVVVAVVALARVERHPCCLFTSKAVERLLLVGVHLQRQRGTDAEHFQQKGQVLAVDAVTLGITLDELDQRLRPWACFRDRRGRARVIAEPQLCLWLAGRRGAEQPGQGITRTPRIGARGVLNEDQHIRSSLPTRYHTDYDRE